MTADDARWPPSQAFAEVLVDELVRGGVREAVLSPGSRNAPLGYALVRAERAGRLRLHVRIDERTAGFLAVGLARRSPGPVVVTCTSGTAVANLHPAVVEADVSGVALVLLTADRPAHLRSTGASQTIDQVGIFGSAARLAVDVPAPGAPGTGVGSTVTTGSTDNAAWRALVCRALDVAGGLRSGRPGPVQLDVGFTEPLVPVPLPADLPPALSGRLGGQPWTRLPTGQTSWSMGGDDRPVPPSRTLVVLGDGADPVVAQLAVRAGYPVLAEATAWAVAGSAALSAGSLLLGSPELLDTAPPERVVLSGRPTLGRAFGALLSQRDVELVVVAPAGDWADPQHVARQVVAEVQDVPAPPVDADWAATWRRADVAAARARDAATAEGVEGAALARLVRDAAAVPGAHDAQPGLLICAASQAVRDLDTAGPVPGLDVVSNRGAAGIDGTLSTAVGAALAVQLGRRSGRRAGRAYALVGDLAFLHDLTGLVIGPGEPGPDLTIVVADDGGGAIFATLEYGTPELAGDFERVFGTPHGVDIPALSGGMGVPCTSTGDADGVREALAETSPGLRVLHVRTDRIGRRDRDAAVRSTVRAAVTAVLPLS